MPARKPEIFGHNLNEAAEAAARSFVEREQDAAREKQPGEVERPKEFDQYLELLNGIFKQEWKDLKLDGDAPQIIPEQIHLFEPAAFTRYAEAKLGQDIGGVAAFSDAYRNSISLNEGELKKNPQTFYHQLTHEAIHIISATSVRAEIEPEQKVAVRIHRTGYNAIYPIKDAASEDFRGFNEGIVEKFAMEIKERHWDEIGTVTQLPPNPERRYTYTYAPYITTIESIIDHVAESSESTPDTVWRDMKRGLLSGSMMHLRQIEKAYGPGSMRALAALGRGMYLAPEKTTTIDAAVTSYFTSEDEIVKRSALHEIIKHELPTRHGRARQ